jgi:hypothetical protein
VLHQTASQSLLGTVTSVYSIGRPTIAVLLAIGMELLVPSWHILSSAMLVIDGMGRYVRYLSSRHVLMGTFGMESSVLDSREFLLVSAHSHGILELVAVLMRTPKSANQEIFGVGVLVK